MPEVIVSLIYFDVNAMIFRLFFVLEIFSNSIEEERHGFIKKEN
jgi:hypothetical protein